MGGAHINAIELLCRNLSRNISKNSLGGNCHKFAKNHFWVTYDGIQNMFRREGSYEGSEHMFSFH